VAKALGDRRVARVAAIFGAEDAPDQRRVGSGRLGSLRDGCNRKRDGERQRAREQCSRHRFESSDR